MLPMAEANNWLRCASSTDYIDAFNDIMLLYKGTVHPPKKILSVITHPRKENIMNKFIQQFIFFVRREEPLVNGGRLTRKRRSH